MFSVDVTTVHSILEEQYRLIRHFIILLSSSFHLNSGHLSLFFVRSHVAAASLFWDGTFFVVEVRLNMHRLPDFEVWTT
jgi:hypothetical protein